MSDKPAYVLVTGGREYDNKRAVNRQLGITRQHFFNEGRRMVIVQGGARGADTLARKWCKTLNQPSFTVPAEWATYGQGAGAVRNQQMLDWIDFECVIAFPGGNGTADMIERAKRRGLTVIEVTE